MARRCLIFLVTALLVAVPAHAARFDFAALQRLIQQHDIGTVEELLAALPQTVRSRFALMFESRSLQGATFNAPRAILFGPDARFIVTFNGDPGERGYQTIETLEYDAQTKEFRFRELQFPSNGAGATGVVTSAINPVRCTRCHGNPARPVWDTHPLWPGAYGERYLAGLSRNELAGLSIFLARQPDHPRYRHLVGAQRFIDPATFRPTASSRYAATPAEAPNAELATYLSQFQFEAIARELARQPAFGVFQYALLGTADDACGPVADFYPAALWREQEPRFEDFVRGTAVANSQQTRFKAVRAANAGGSRTARSVPTQASALTGLRFVVAAALELSTRDWSLALEKGTYDFTVPPASRTSMREALLEEVVRRDATIRELFPYATSSDGDRYCTYLKRRSKAALREFMRKTAVAGGAGATAGSSSNEGAAQPDTRSESPPGTAAVPAAPTALQRCSQCHETGIAPSLAFSNATELKRDLRERPSAHGALLDEIRFRLSAAAGAQTMPLGVALPEAERRALEAYFIALAASPD